MYRLLMVLTAMVALIGLVVGVVIRPNSEPVFKGKSASAWLAQMQAPEFKERREATAALGWLGPAAGKSVPVLISALNDPDQFVRANAGIALGRFGSIAVPALIVQLESDSPDIRRGSCLALGYIGKPSEPAIPALVHLLSDFDASVRQEAARTLG